MIEKNIYPKSGMAIIRSTIGRAVIGPAAPSPMPEVYVSPEADETQYSEAPRVFSKLRLVAALMDAGLWTQVKAFIEAQGLMDLYLAAQTFREDDAHFAPALAALKSQLAVPDEEVEKILAAAALPQT